MKTAKARQRNLEIETNAAQLSDRDLVAACIRNSASAWRELVDRYDKGLRVKAYRRCEPFLDSIPNDYQDDIMGAFYLRLVDSDMNALRTFDFDKSTALFKWFSRLVGQCAKAYLSTELDHGVGRAEVADALDLADEGGVLASGVRRFEGSLSTRVRAEKANAEKVESLKRYQDRRRRRREGAKRLAMAAAA